MPVGIRADKANLAIAVFCIFQRPTLSFCLEVLSITCRRLDPFIFFERTVQNDLVFSFKSEILEVDPPYLIKDLFFVVIGREVGDIQSVGILCFETVARWMDQSMNRSTPYL